MASCTKFRAIYASKLVHSFVKVCIEPNFYQLYPIKSDKNDEVRKRTQLSHQFVATY